MTEERKLKVGDVVYEIHTGSKPSNIFDDLIYDLYDDLIWKSQKI